MINVSTLVSTKLQSKVLPGKLPEITGYIKGYDRSNYLRIVIGENVSDKLFSKTLAMNN